MKKCKETLLRVFFSLLLSGLLSGCNASWPAKSEQALQATNTPEQVWLWQRDVLEQLLVQTGIVHNGTLNDVVAKTQQAWLRPAGVERYQLNNDQYGDKKELCMPLFSKLGMVDSIMPVAKKYDYGIVLGALLPRVRARLAFLAHLWRAGVRFRQLIFLASARPLDNEQESEKTICDTTQTLLPCAATWSWNGVPPKTECDMMNIVYQQADLPDDLRAVPVVFVDTPMQLCANGTLRRPTTMDTVVTWLEQKPAPGSCLVFSNQPYILYQKAVVTACLSSLWQIEAVGPAIDAVCMPHMAILFDTLARRLWQEQKKLSH